MSDLYEFIKEQTIDLNPIMRLLIVFVFCGLALVGIALVKNESFRKDFFSFFKNIFKQKTKIILLKHNLFLKKSYFLKDISNIHFESELKTDLFKILITEKVKASISLTEQFIKKISDKITDNQLFFECSENITNVVNTSETAINQAFVDYFFDKKDLTKKDAYIIGNKEFDFIYLKEKGGFKDVDNTNNNFVLKNIEKIIYSSAFTRKRKLLIYLNLIDTSLEIAIADLEKLFNDFNGEIDKMAKI